MKKLLGCVASLVFFFGCAPPASKVELEDKIEKTTKDTPLILEHSNSDMNKESLPQHSNHHSHMWYDDNGAHGSHLSHFSYLHSK